MAGWNQKAQSRDNLLTISNLHGLAGHKSVRICGRLPGDGGPGEGAVEPAFALKWHNLAHMWHNLFHFGVPPVPISPIECITIAPIQHIGTAISLKACGSLRPLVLRLVVRLSAGCNKLIVPVCHDHFWAETGLELPPIARGAKPLVVLWNVSPRAGHSVRAYHQSGWSRLSCLAALRLAPGP